MCTIIGVGEYGVHKLFLYPTTYIFGEYLRKYFRYIKFL